MKKIYLLFIISIILTTGVSAQKYEFNIVTVIESIIPGGLGRSRMITPTVSVNYKDFLTIRETGSKKKNNSVRGDIRIKDFEETKLLNFFSVVGIRFENIASNDAMVVSKLNDMSLKGWELFSVNTGVESYAGNKSGDKSGLFITRYLFRRAVE